jgi:PhzF family phenazine biosynthesis protein
MHEVRTAFFEEDVMSLPLFHVDSFSDRPFSGNPAAVCILPAWKEDSWLQAVARETNLSATAFLVQQAHQFDLRWFTAKVELGLCGHGTLASAHILWQQGYTNGDRIRFSTRGGTLTAVRHGNESELDLPLKPEKPTGAPPEMLDALGVSATYVGKNEFDYLVEVESATVLRGIAPDFKRLTTIPARGVIVTSRSDDARFDFISRFFAPSIGIDEDPVTGSAHCCLGDYWRKRLGRSEFTAFQASARSGVVRVRVTNDRAFLGGPATTVAKADLLV